MIQICVSLTDETTAATVSRLGELPAVADLVEVRGDLVLDLDLLAILRARREHPLIFTARPVSEGGRWPDQDPRRRYVLLEAAKRGFDYVDVEYRSAFNDVVVEKAGRGLIVSFHDLEGVPEDLDELYRQMCRSGADIVKIAVTPRSVSEVGRLLGLAARAQAKGGTPLVAIAMGPLGAITRVVGGRYGAPFTYASMAAGAEAASGQIPAALLADLYRVKEVSAQTKVYGVLGTNVTRSLSPLLHNRAFQAAGVDAVYVPLQADTLPAFIEALPDLGLSGFSVTRPYKVEILAYLQEVDETAATCGSVNTVVVHDGTLQGSTTDGSGVVASLRRRVELKGLRVVILGAGGAARAAAFALKRKGALVTVLARDGGRAAAVALQVGCESGDLEAAPAYEWDVVLNATPIGGGHHVDVSPLPADAHRKGTIAFDMVYDPLETRFLREAQAAGASIVDGLEMLIAQAAAQFETWTGLEAPLAEMKAAALRVAQEQEG